MSAAPDSLGGWELRECGYVGFGTVEHVVPINDLRRHDMAIQTRGSDCRGHCWCGPVLHETGRIVHNSMDQREIFERGEAMLS